MPSSFKKSIQGLLASVRSSVMDATGASLDDAIRRSPVTSMRGAGKTRLLPASSNPTMELLSFTPYRITPAFTKSVTTKGVHDWSLRTLQSTSLSSYICAMDVRT